MPMRVVPSFQPRPGSFTEALMIRQSLPELAKDAKMQEEALDCYKRVRDEIKAFVLTLSESLTMLEGQLLRYQGMA